MTLRSALLHTALAKCKNAAACPPADALNSQTELSTHRTGMVQHQTFTNQASYSGFDAEGKQVPEGKMKLVSAGSSSSIASIQDSSRGAAFGSKDARLSLLSDEFSSGVATAEPTSISLDWIVCNCKTTDTLRTANLASLATLLLLNHLF